MADAVNQLAIATENIAKPHQESCPPPPPPQEIQTAPIDSGGWLTFLAILIALSAYMSNLRWALIKNLGQIKHKSGVFEKYEPDDLIKSERKSQKNILWISVIDFLLIVAAWAIIIHLFWPFPSQSFKLSENVAVFFFMLAAAVFSLLHAKEWVKTFKKWCTS